MLLTSFGRDSEKGGEKILSEKEILFCKNYIVCQNPKEAALKAGFSLNKSEKIAQKLLLRKDINLLLKNLEPTVEKNKIFSFLITALKRMIFYRPNDIFYLFKNLDVLKKEEIEKLDLFQITEIKKLKDGGLELKLIDRIKAIETLINILEKIENKMEVESFLKALTTKPAYYEDD